MPSVFLCTPLSLHKQPVWAYRQEFLNSGDSIDGSCGLAWAATFEEWLARVQGAEHPAGETVPTTVFLVMDAVTCQLVGMIALRHRLDDHLARWGGHVGYSVRPGLRNRGYATAALQALLPYCRSLGLNQLLLSCWAENLPSAQVMKHCGGTLTREIQLNQKAVHHYHLPL